MVVLRVVGVVPVMLLLPRVRLIRAGQVQVGLKPPLLFAIQLLAVDPVAVEVMVVNSVADTT